MTHAHAFEPRFAGGPAGLGGGPRGFGGGPPSFRGGRPGFRGLLAMAASRGRGRRHGPRGGRPPGGGRGFGGWGGPPFGGPPFWQRRRRPRGDVRAAMLLVLAEQPLSGYGLMQEIESRSEGVWRPSPGSVYPALAQLEDEGLVR